MAESVSEWTGTEQDQSLTPADTFVHSPDRLTILEGPKHFSAMANIPAEFPNVTAVTKANIYFDGKVVSHTIRFPDDSTKTLGLIHAGRFHFGTDAAERMEIVAGECHVKPDGQDEDDRYAPGESFDVPAKSGFDIEVKTGICEYICTFIA